MTDAAAALPEDGPPPRDPDQRVVIHGVSWAQYEALLSVLGERAGVRVYYLEGAVEIMTPSRSHEVRKSMIGRLIEAWAVETGTPLNAYGSATFRKRAKERGAEPDECYALDRVLSDDRPAEMPDLAIEIAWTRGGLDKLAIYAGLGVPELWMWRRGRIAVYRLRGDGYEAVPGSELLPSLDLELLTRFIERPDQTEAVREYLHALRAG